MSKSLNEMMDEIRAEFPADCIPSRSALGREKKNFAAEAKEFREIAAASEVLVKEFGEDLQNYAYYISTKHSMICSKPRFCISLYTLDHN